MNDSAQTSSSMVSRIKSPLLSQQPASSDPANSSAASQDLSDAQKLALFEQVLNQVEDPSALNPTHPVKSGGKEATESSTSPDTSSIDAGGGLQYVEQEKNPEIPVEVEGYLQKVDDYAEEKMPEIYIADGTQENPDTPYPSRPVIVLPISEAVEEAGLKKNPTFSIRWLVEWSHKIIKMFAGKVVYKDEPVSNLEN